MAFLKIDFNKCAERKYPTSLEECLSNKDEVSTRLWDWARGLQFWGKIILIIIAVFGTILTFSVLADEGGGAAFSLILVLAVVALIEYCTYYALSLLMCALASIVQSNRITSDIAIYSVRLPYDSVGQAQVQEAMKKEREEDFQRQKEEAAQKVKKEQEEQEKKARFNAYWKEHAAEKEALLKKKAEAEEKLKGLSSLATEERKAIQNLIRAIEVELTKER